MEPDPHSLLADLETTNYAWNKKYKALTEALGSLILDFSLVRFYPLNIKKEGNIADILLTIDNAIQYGEDADVKTKDFEMPDEEEEAKDYTQDD